jgi:orotidine-5'-phosphate decarboxylase
LKTQEKVILAIDTSDKSEAEKLATLAHDAGALYVKLGTEIQSATSWEYCSELARANGLGWVADAKLDDIPNTVAQTVKNIATLSHPPFGITMHTTAGVDSMRAAQKAAGEVKVLGVTILTSISEEEARKIYNIPESMTVGEKVLELAEKAAISGLMGVVASPKEVGMIKKNPKTKNLFAMIPGSRSVSADSNDQARSDTPAATIKNGADLLVIGRQITQADNPAEAYNQLLKEIEGVTSES